MKRASIYGTLIDIIEEKHYKLRDAYVSGASLEELGQQVDSYLGFMQRIKARLGNPLDECRESFGLQEKRELFMRIRCNRSYWTIELYRAGLRSTFDNA